jgi:hypothetical protein
LPLQRARRKAGRCRVEYTLPIAGPLSDVLAIDGVRYALASAYAELPVGLK